MFDCSVCVVDDGLVDVLVWVISLAVMVVAEWEI